LIVSVCCLPFVYVTVVLYDACSRIKGIPEASIPVIVQSYLDMVHVSEHADKQTFKYSGGSKRKLSLAIALMGWPAAVLLDGMSALSLHVCTPWRADRDDAQS